MCWQWARSSCAVAVVAPVKPHGQVQGSGSAQPSSTVPKGTLADLPRGTNTAILALVEKQALCSSCQPLLFHRDFPKSMFFLGFTFCSRTGYNAGAHIPPHSQHRAKEPVSTPSVCPMPRQARADQGDKQPTSHHTAMHTQQGTHQSQVVLGLSVGEQGENREAPLTQAPHPRRDRAHWHHTLASVGHTQVRVVPGTGFAPARVVHAGIQAFLLGSPLQHGPSQFPPLQHRTTACICICSSTEHPRSLSAGRGPAPSPPGVSADLWALTR